MFQAGGLPDEIATPLVKVSAQEGPHIWIVPLLVQTGLANSNSEARRLIQQGAVRVNGERVEDVNARLTTSEPQLLQVGRRRFARLLPENIIRVSQ
jgi:tyrosyl-tRNA synthetase